MKSVIMYLVSFLQPEIRFRNSVTALNIINLKQYTELDTVSWFKMLNLDGCDRHS
jgi:hypothetical protein